MQTILKLFNAVCLCFEFLALIATFMLLLYGRISIIVLSDSFKMLEKECV